MNKILTKISKIALAAVFSVGLGVASMGAPVLAAACDTGDVATLGLEQGANCAKNKDQADTLFGDGGIFTTIVNVLLFLIGMVSVIMIITGGIRYVLSSGDAGKVTTAKNTILYAVVGLVVSILAYAIVNFVVKSFANKN